MTEPDWSRIVHQDDDLLVVDKPAGDVVQPGDHPEAPVLPSRFGDEPLWLARGLERAASGLVVYARQRDVLAPLEKQLAAGPPRSWVVGLDAKAMKGAKARNLEELGREGNRLLLRLREEGKRPPLRKRLDKRGVAIAGSGRQALPAPRLMQHRATLALKHPRSGELLELEAAPPPAFERWLRGTDERLPRDPDELDARLTEALSRRWALDRDPELDVYRIAHGAGDALPGVELDRYADWGVLALCSEDALALRNPLLDACMRLRFADGEGLAGLYLKLRPKQANVVADTRDGEIAPPRAQRGDSAPGTIIVNEGPLRFRAHLGDGLSTGLFLDQRDARRWLHDRAAGASVLNLFCYHAVFSVAAIVGGARRTVSVDTSGVALDEAQRNLDLAGGGDNELLKRDARRYLQQGGERFDVVVLDPPSYATSKRSTFRASRDYQALATLALKRLAPRGTLLACTNHRGVTRSKFRRQLRQAAEQAGVRVARLTELTPAIDFPAAPGRDPHLKRVLVETGR